MLGPCTPLVCCYIWQPHYLRTGGQPSCKPHAAACPSFLPASQQLPTNFFNYSLLSNFLRMPPSSPRPRFSPSYLCWKKPQLVYHASIPCGTYSWRCFFPPTLHLPHRFPLSTPPCGVPTLTPLPPPPPLQFLPQPPSPPSGGKSLTMA